MRAILDKQIARARKRMGEERWQLNSIGSGINDRRTPRNPMSPMTDMVLSRRWSAWVRQPNANTALVLAGVSHG